MLHVSEEGDDIDATIRLDANHLRVLSKVLEAAADEMDARAVSA